MARKIQFSQPELTISSFDDDTDDCLSFDDSPTESGKCISSFNFCEDNTLNTTINVQAPQKTNSKKSSCSNEPIPLNVTEEPSIKRTYVLKKSTIRKISEIKSIHPDINICVSMIVDAAINYYYDYIVNKSNKYE